MKPNTSGGNRKPKKVLAPVLHGWGQDNLPGNPFAKAAWEKNGVRLSALMSIERKETKSSRFGG